ncbi:MAG: hypothetical protein HYZ28_03235 [Myxococcales bacterium]|nr:hypothetical protein [Myxococcales bacterium]
MKAASPAVPSAAPAEAASSAGPEGQAAPSARPADRLEVSAFLQNLVLFRSDSDFDRTPPAYAPSGQSVGAFATLFRPRLTFHALPTLHLEYEAELGLNFWSKHNPDQPDAVAPDAFVLKHRVVYARGELGKNSFKVGYARFQDPTGLFLHHWIGIAEGQREHSFGRIGLFLGQIPDPVHEGISLGTNNFQRDIFVGGVSLERPAGRFRLGSAISALVDNHLVGQSRWVVSPSMRLEGELGAFSTSLDAVAQLGRQEGVALAGSAMNIGAWAIQVHAEREREPLALAFNLLALSADDAIDGNRLGGAFLYSGKSRSATVMLTEDELRDWLDNLDERFGPRQGGFVVNRAGLLVLDGKASWAVAERVRAGGIIGAASVMQPANALGGFLVGVEADLFATVRLNERLCAHALAGVLIPGPAGAALINSIDLSRQGPIAMGEAALEVSY